MPLQMNVSYYKMWVKSNRRLSIDLWYLGLKNYANQKYTSFLILDQVSANYFHKGP